MQKSLDIPHINKSMLFIIGILMIFMACSSISFYENKENVIVLVPILIVIGAIIVEMRDEVIALTGATIAFAFFLVALIIVAVIMWHVAIIVLCGLAILGIGWGSWTLTKLTYNLILDQFEKKRRTG